MILEVIAGGLLHHGQHHHTSRSAHRLPLHNWSGVAECESSGDWSTNTGNGFFGGTQIAEPTWIDFGGLGFASRPDLATKRQQIVVDERILAAQGWGAWPTCSRLLGLR